MSLDRLAMRIGKAVALTVILAWSLGPIVLIVASSFKPERDIFATPPRLAFTPTFAHYVDLVHKWPDFFKGLANSLMITGGATLLAVAASTLAAYAYSRYRGRLLSASAFYLIFIRLIPPIIITLPLFPLINYLRLNDTHAVLIVLYATFFVSLGTFIMRTFIDQIPVELDEAAKVDGARPRQILAKIIVPLAAQGMIAVSVFVIVYAWNEFLFAFIFTTTRAKTAPLALSEMLGASESVDWGVLFAASTIQLVPILIFIILAQRHLIAGLTAGATKG
jgi:multiple sugar transport system permease protein